MYDLISIGDIKLDTFISIPEASVLCRKNQPTCELCIANGTKIPIKTIEHQIAGSAPNVAIGVSRLGGSSTVLSTMGLDNTFKDAQRFLRKEGVSPRYVYGLLNYQSSFSAVLNFQGESTQLAAHSHIPFKFPKRFPRTKWFHLSELGSNYESLFEYILSMKEKYGFKLSFNPGAVQIKERSSVFDQVLSVTDLLFVNRLEAGILLDSQDADVHDLLTGLHSLTPGTVVVTDGKRGAYGYDGRMQYHAPMFPGERVEATGAGDSFTSGFIGGLLHNNSLDSCLAWGSVNAAYCVQFVGPTKGLLEKDTLLRYLKENAEYRVIPY